MGAKYILFDTETTGINQEDRAIEIGGMIISSRTDIECHSDLCSTDIPIKVEAMEIHNITQEMIANKPKIQDTIFYKKLLELNNDNNFLIAHNIKFDLEMVKKEGFENNYTLIDTLRCSKHLFKDLRYYRLQYLRYALELYELEVDEARNLNIELKAHSVIGDTLIMKILLKKLLEECKKQYPDMNPMIKLSQLTNTPVMIQTFNFGKHRGKNIAEVSKEDLGYIQWIRNNMENLDEDLKYTLDAYLK